MKKINLLMGLHCHQPVDNLEWIFKEAYEKSYEPFLSVLEKHPGVKLSFHYSGPLLEWLVSKKPGFMDRVKKLINRNQIEILTGGYFEPILSMVPREDAGGQIRMSTQSIEKHLGCSPRGAWLAERVWDPAVAGIFKDANVEYTILDDFHLKGAGVKNTRVFNHYAVKGFESLSVFASIKKLRYTMPFKPPEVTLEFLRSVRNNPEARSVTFADDCEKFGFWPYTYDWVYKKGWLDKFFTMLEENDWIKTSTFSEALEECPPLGKIEIPASSYAEMSGWASGNFDNFFRKYPESNLMRNRMLYVSERVNNLFRPRAEIAPNSSPGLLEQTKKELYKAQSNCAYWHGVFGGIYTNYLRQGVYSHIINAENFLEDNGIEIIKFQNDKNEVISARNKFLTVFINPEYAGSIFEIDYKPASCNLVNTISRRYEPYHEKLKSIKKRNLSGMDKKLENEEDIDLYEVLGVKERNLKKHLNYDTYQKFSCICHAMDLKANLADFIRSRHVNLGGDSLFGPFNYKTESRDGRLVINLEREGRLRLKKCIILEKRPEISMRFDLENTSGIPVKLIFGVEFNWSVEDKKFMRPKEIRWTKRITLSDKNYNLKIRHVFNKRLDLWSFPVYTLNETERGISKSFQEVSVLFHKKLALKKGEKFSLEGKISILK